MPSSRLLASIAWRLAMLVCTDRNPACICHILQSVLDHLSW